MTRYAVLLSVEQYTNLPATPFAEADAALLGRTLVDCCDYAEQHVLCVHLTPGENHSPASVLAQIKDTAARLQPGDTMLFFFAGHGHLDGGETFLVLPDSSLDATETTALPLRDLTAELRVPRCGCFRILDACHSGTDVRAGTTLNSQGFVDALLRGQSSGWVTLAACAESELSVADANVGHGVFTYHLCEEITAFDEGQEILPEILKTRITPKILEHAKKLGNEQTPTMNASLTGNVALAIRRASRKSATPKDDAEPTLSQRCEALRAVQNILEPERLRAYLQKLVDEVTKAIRADSPFRGEITVGEPLRAGSIPDEMHKSIVDFTRQRGFSTQHEHSRVTERVGDSFSISALLGTRRTVVHYSLDQPASLPPSASVVQISGDGRCVPTMSLLVYVIPLQMCCCLLVAGFRGVWSPRDDSLTHVFSGYHVLRPDEDESEFAKLARFAAREIHARLEKHVAERVSHLERELSADP